jgi:archaellum component FlaC
MDTLRAQHCFDQIEAYLTEVKNDVTSNPYDPDTIGLLNDKINDLESDLSDEKDRADDLDRKVEDYESTAKAVIKILQEVKQDISFHHPLYSQEDIDDAISNLESI